MEIKLSIVIPVYGVGDYIEDCFHSLLPQINENIEVIVINDGCLDDSIDKLRILIDEYFSSKKIYIKIIDQKNQGQSVARNNGVAISSGDYIAFIDPDDLVTEKYINTILKVINSEKKIDIIHFNAYQLEDKSGEFLSDLNLVNKSNSLIKNDSFLEEIFLKNMWYPWMRVIRSEIMRDYLFVPNIYLEDMNLFPELYYDERVKKITEISEKLVIYRIRENSSIGDPLNKKIIGGIDYGLEKFSIRGNRFYSIVYNNLLLQRVSLFFQQKKSFRYISDYCDKHLNNIQLDYRYSSKIWFFSKFNFLYLILLKIKSVFVSKEFF